MKKQWIVLAGVCAVVVGIYAYMVQSPIYEQWKSLTPEAAYAPYNLLMRGFRAGQLSLKLTVPPGLTQLPDPYDPMANDFYREAPYKLHDLIYYKGRLYLYFGVAPVVLLFWPFAVLTGHYLIHRDAVLIFCTIGFLVSAGLLRALWRRYFADVSIWVVAACVVAFGLASGTPMLLARAGLQEVPISCGYMLTMLALAAIWCALHEPDRSCRWLAAASLAYGLAVSSRPNLVFGAIILLVPVLQAWRERRKVWAPLLAAIVPIALVGLGLMVYNARRFDNPFEIGVHYALTAENLVSHHLVGLQFLWFHFRVYFLEPARWSGRFPFVHNIVMPPLPAGSYGMEPPFGVLTSIPVVCLALAAPLAWRTLPGPVGSGLRWFAGTVALLFGICAATLSLIYATAFRYEVDFLPTLMVLAVIGILGCERALVDRPAWRYGARLGWGLLLGVSVAFNLLVTLEYYAYTQNELGRDLSETRNRAEAAMHFEKAVWFKPDYPEAHFNLGAMLMRMGKTDEAIVHFQRAVQLQPDYVEALINLGTALMKQGDTRGALAQYEEALRHNSDSVAAHVNLGIILMAQGRAPEAIAHYEKALQVDPDDTDAHDKLGIALAQVGRVSEAITNWEAALRIKPDDAEAHYNYGVALQRLGRMTEAIEHYEQALRTDPNSAEAHSNLATAYAQTGRFEEAIPHYEQALRIKPDYAEAHNNLGITLGHESRFEEAIGHYEQALRLNPDYVEAHFNLGLTLEKLGRAPEAIAQYQQALKLRPDYAPASNALARLQAGQ